MCAWGDDFSVHGGSRERYAMAQTRMPVHRLLPASQEKSKTQGSTARTIRSARTPPASADFLYNVDYPRAHPRIERWAPMGSVPHWWGGFPLVVSSMRSMRYMRGGFIFRNRGPLLKVHHSQCLTSMTKHDAGGSPPGAACNSAKPPHGKTQGSASGWRSRLSSTH